MHHGLDKEVWIHAGYSMTLCRLLVQTLLSGNLVYRALLGATWAMVSLDTVDTGNQNEFGWKEPGIKYRQQQLSVNNL